MSFDLQILNGDFTITGGDITTVSDANKLAQDVLKICLTPNGANPFYSWYGSPLSKTIVGSSMPENMILQMARVQLENSLQNLKSLQELQVKSLQRVTAPEQINAILDILVSRNPIDFRLFTVNVRILNKGFQPITTAFTVSTI